jgi:anti-anti-sigma factor
VFVWGGRFSLVIGGLKLGKESATASAESDPRAVVTVDGELDVSNVQRLDAAVALIIAARPHHLLVDIGGLRFADSSAIAVWVRWAGAAGEVELRDASPLLQQVIMRMGLQGKLRLQR